MNLLSFLNSGYTLGQFASFFGWALVGAYILVQSGINNRDPNSSRTPTEFSWKFWFRDNARRVAFNGVLILVAIRFSKEITGKDINEFWAFVIGLSSDGLAQLINYFKISKLTGTATMTKQEKKDDI